MNGQSLNIPAFGYKGGKPDVTWGSHKCLMTLSIPGLGWKWALGSQGSQGQNMLLRKCPVKQAQPCTHQPWTMRILCPVEPGGSIAMYVVSSSKVSTGYPDSYVGGGEFKRV